ncbi:DUF4307 domain-containing protein [Planotetraspora sp. GP83]|uniref:DUF4307 domain-containing protein n=1 Tax=Planotetraspora sp. GP83 TaxID=3156264 RepID=UPI003516F15A
MPSDEVNGTAGGPGARPILGTPDDFEERPAGPGRFLAYLIIGAIVAIIAGGWGYVMVAARGNPEVRAEVIAFDASAPTSAQITFSVHKPADREATCRLRAVDTQHIEVGSREIDVPRGKSDLAFTERLKTSAQATAVHVQYCNLV